MFTSYTRQIDNAQQLCDRCRKFLEIVKNSQKEEKNVHFDRYFVCVFFVAMNRVCVARLCTTYMVYDSRYMRTKLNHLLKCHWKEKVFLFFAGVVVGLLLMLSFCLCFSTAVLHRLPDRKNGIYSIYPFRAIVCMCACSLNDLMRAWHRRRWWICEFFFFYVLIHSHSQTAILFIALLLILWRRNK